MALNAGRKCDVLAQRLAKSPGLRKMARSADRTSVSRGLIATAGRRFHQTSAIGVRRAKATLADKTRYSVRNFGTSKALGSQSDPGNNRYQLVVVGGGTGGCSVAAKYARQLGPGKVAVIEPSETHYYQPMWTLVGGGVKTVNQSARPMDAVLPRNCSWIQDKVVTFDPKNNSVTTSKGREISYDFLVVAMGLQLNFDWIKGLPEAFDADSRLCSNYSRQTVEKTFPALQAFQSGNAIFTFPNTPIKCAGAPQKIMYLAEHFFRKSGKRDKANVIFNSSLGVIFGVKKYAESLLEIIKDRSIQVNYKRELIEVKPETSEAIFKKLDSEAGELETFKYDFMHITPPMSAPDVLRQSPLVDASGFVNVNKETLQHMEYPNIFGIGDCTNVPTSKTAAAAAAQTGILKKNMDAFMSGKGPQKMYDGYTSCPLITGYGKCILAEFDFNGQPLETFPINQGKERRSMWHMKKDLMPELYWYLFLKGRWEGPAIYRKMMGLGMKK